MRAGGVCPEAVCETPAFRHGPVDEKGVRIADMRLRFVALAILGVVSVARWAGLAAQSVADDTTVVERRGNLVSRPL